MDVCRRLAPLTLLALALGCSGFRAAEIDTSPTPDLATSDGSPPKDTSSNEGPADAAPDMALPPCPGGLSAPSVLGAAALPQKVPLGTPAKLEVNATDAEGLGLVMRFDAPAGSLTQGSPESTWQLDQVPLDFLTRSYRIDVEVAYACEGSPTASTTIDVEVYGNVIVSDWRQNTLEVFGSNGAYLGTLTSGGLGTPGVMLLLSAKEIAVADIKDKDVKIVRLTDGQVVRSFGSTVSELEPFFLDRLSDGSVLVAPAARNQIVRFDPQSGSLMNTITAPHTFQVAGLTHLADDTIVSGISGTGRFYKNAPDGSPGSHFFTIAETYDTRALRALSGDELLVSIDHWDRYGALVRIDATGQEIERENYEGFFSPNPATLTPFIGGFLFTEIVDTDVYFVADDLSASDQPFASLGSDSLQHAANDALWLHAPPTP